MPLSLWLVVAFATGFIAKLLRLPPLVGYLIAGFALHAFGIPQLDLLETLANYGITLLLFTIGLKLNVHTLLKPEILVTAISHMTLVTLISTGTLLLVGTTGISILAGLSIESALIIGFGMSFSSTVCAIKILEERGEMSSRHGQIAIGILVLQDIVAVAFLTITKGQYPNWMAVSVLALPLLRPVFSQILRTCGHGELLALAGFFFAFAGASYFEWVGIKGDFGALLLGMVLSRDPKAYEVSKQLLNFKELFLIGFFLSIGFYASLSVDIVITALGLSLFLILKAILFFFILVKTKVRARTALLATITLLQMSEFGLIVTQLAVSQDWIGAQWLVIMAISLFVTFIISTLLSAHTNNIYDKFQAFWHRFESSERLSEDTMKQPGKVDVLIIGMGSLGTSVYQSVQSGHKLSVCGVDSDQQTVADHLAKGRHVIPGDGTDLDFWQGLKYKEFTCIMLTGPAMIEMLDIAKQLEFIGYKGNVAALTEYEDQVEELQEAGINTVFHFVQEVGTGFASHVLADMGKRKSMEPIVEAPA